MNLELAETIVRWVGGLLAYATLGIVLYGIWRGTLRQAGRSTGRMGHHLRSFWFYLFSTVLFVGIGYGTWVPLPLVATQQTRIWTLALGSLLFFPGLSFALWGRLALGKNYFVSTGFGAQLFEGHELITTGPFALVRHPMYSGLILMSLGSLLIYFTWTTLLFACIAPLITTRAFREEKVLAAEFEVHWQEYRCRVPMFVPRFRPSGKEG